MTDALAKHGIPDHLHSYVCIEVFTGERPILYVSRADGDWCFLCGDGHPNSADFYRVVGIAHPIAADPTLVEVLDLVVDEEAERSAVGESWVRSHL